MTCRLVLSAILLLALSSALAAADEPFSPVPETQITVGQQVTIHGTNLPTDVRLYLRTGDEQSGDKGIALGAKGDGKALTFLVPANTVAHRYLVYAVLGDKEIQVPGDLHVLPDTPASVSLEAIYPQTDYRDALEGKFSFEIAGQNLAAKPEDNVIEVVGQGPVTVKNGPCETDKNAKGYELPCLEHLESVEGMETYKLRVIGFHPVPYQGPVQIRVRVGKGSKNVSNPVPVTFSAASQAGVLVAAAAVFGALMLLFFRLVRKGVGSYTIGGEKFGTWASLFLDPQTNSYSLSKFQVLAWTAVTVYAYIYLFLCRTLIQWDLSFPSVSQNLPGLFFASAGTTVAAAAITSSYGSKGAGPAKPSMADFISTGGLVAGERFQFFIWTIVGCLGYVYLVIRSNPAKLTELPNVPDNFLYLMGVSSAGYLGGKLVRKPGPVIKTLSVTTVTPRAPGPPAVPASIAINLKGENLDPKASIKVDDKALRGGLFSITGKPDPPDPQTKFCTELDVTLNDADKYIEGTHTLTVVNTDAQAATVSFPIDPLSIDSVPDLNAGAAAADVAVTGKNFADGMTAVWTDAAGVQSAAAIQNRQGTTQLTVPLIPGVAGTGKLTLTSAIGLKASKEVTVRTP